MVHILTESINQLINQSNLMEEKSFTGHVGLKESAFPCPENKTENLNYGSSN